MEISYNKEKVAPIFWDMMKVNNFCVKSSSMAVAFDEENKHRHLRLKYTPVTPCIEVAVMRSHHVIIMGKAAKKWGIPKRHIRIRSTLLEHDIIELERVISSCDIVVLHERMLMSKDNFWIVIHPRVNVGSLGDRNKTHVHYTKHKQELVCR
jgi:hypothetical protein